MSKRQKAAGLLAGITAMLIFAPTVAENRPATISARSMHMPARESRMDA